LRKHLTKKLYRSPQLLKTTWPSHRLFKEPHLSPRLLERTGLTSGPANTLPKQKHHSNHLASVAAVAYQPKGTSEMTQSHAEAIAVVAKQMMWI
jgi:hypothetical protein